MENASKALIIAGAILISILIIGLGVFIYNKAKGAMDDSINLDSQKIQSINAKFEQYEGTGVSAADVRALTDLIRTHNNQYPNAKIGVTGSFTDVNTIKTTVGAGSTYSVKITSYYGDLTTDPAAYKGFIKTINIQ